MAQVAQSLPPRVADTSHTVAFGIDSQSQWALAWRRFKRNRAAVVSLFVIAFYMLIAIIGPSISPQNPVKDNSGMEFIPAFWRAESPAGVARNSMFPIGTDQQGHDVLSRVIHGTRASMAAGILPVIIVLLIGMALGFTSGWLGGFADNLLMRITDIFFAFPEVLFLILMMVTLGDTELGKFGNGLPFFLLALAVVSWAGLARQMRGSALALRSREYIDASRSVGASTWHIITRHIFPNSLSIIVVWAAFAVPRFIISEAILGYIGLGLRPSLTGRDFFVTSWGRLFLESYSNVGSQPDYLLFVAVVASVLVIAFTFVGDGLRDALDPRMKR